MDVDEALRTLQRIWRVKQGYVFLPYIPAAIARSANKERRAGELIAKNMNFVMVFGSAIIVLLILLADPIVALLGGPDFADSAVPLRCVGVAVMFSAMNIVLANYMISKGKERSWAAVNATGFLSLSNWATSRTRTTSSIWCPRTGGRVRSVPLPRPWMPFLENV